MSFNPFISFLNNNHSDLRPERKELALNSTIPYNNFKIENKHKIVYKKKIKCKLQC